MSALQKLLHIRSVINSVSKDKQIQELKLQKSPNNKINDITLRNKKSKYVFKHTYNAYSMSLNLQYFLRIQ